MIILNTAVKIKAAMLSKLKDSAITATDVEKLKLQPLTASQVVKLDFPQAAAFKIPYFDFKGKKTKFYRIRYLEPINKTGFSAQTIDKKPLRYIQPPNTINPAYFSPTISWPQQIKDPNVSFVITEGELKAIAGCKLGIPVIGLGGVWNFRAVKKQITLLPDLTLIEWKDRIVYIAYDSDSVNNPNVMLAEKVLAEELTHRGAKVSIVRIPPINGNSKTGLDDYIVVKGKAATLKLFSDHSYPFEFSISLHNMNSEVVYVRDPGIVVENDSLFKMTPAAYTNHAYANRFHVEYSMGKNQKITSKKKATASSWVQWEFRSELLALTYSPGNSRVTASNELNTWSGWGVESIKGNVQPWKQLLDHIFSRDKEARKWFEQWCAYPIQHPGIKLFTAPVIWGLTEGTMKTAMGHTLMRVYGRNAVEIHDKQLRDDRNEWAESKQFVLADDITGHNNRELANRLKTLITRKTIRLDPKYVPSYSVPDCINYYFTSNDVDAFFLTVRDRRYFIWEVRAGKPSLKWVSYFIDWRDKGDLGIAALRYHLEHSVDLTGFNPQAQAYGTTAKDQMVSLVRSDLNEWVFNLGLEGPLEIGGVVSDGDLWTSIELLRRYDPERKTGVKANGIARELTKLGHRQLKQVRVDGSLVRLFALRNHEKWERAKSKLIIRHYEETCPDTQRKKIMKASIDKKRY